MKVKVNGLVGEGTLVIPRAKSYVFEIEGAGKLDLFTFYTCNREEIEKKAGESGWFGNSKRRKFTYVPIPLESEEYSCPVQIGVYEAKKGRHSWFFGDFLHPKLKLHARVSCNGKVYNAPGVSVCDSYEGSLQEIKFSVPVLAPEEDVCVKLQSKDDMTFQIKLPRGECSFRFVTKTGEEEWHRLTTLGHQKILLRED